MTILCVACGDDVLEEQYPNHMQQKHPEGQLSAMQKQKLVKQNITQNAGLPPGISEVDLPDEEFMKTVAEIEKQQQNPIPPSPKPQEVKPTSLSHPAPPPAVTPQTEDVKLTYKYEGTCRKGHPISTLEIDIAGSHHVIAYCTICKVQCEEREVENLDKKFATSSITSTMIQPPGSPIKIKKMPSLKKLPKKEEYAPAHV